MPIVPKLEPVPIPPVRRVAELMRNHKKIMTSDDMKFLCAVNALPDLIDALQAIQSAPNEPRAHRKALDALKKAGCEL